MPRRFEFTPIVQRIGHTRLRQARKTIVIARNQGVEGAGVISRCFTRRLLVLLD